MISNTLVKEVLDHVAAAACLQEEPLLASLRERFEEIHVSVCRDDDMPSRIPFAAENALCRVYYVSSGDHCLSLTSDAGSATGLVVALVYVDAS